MARKKERSSKRWSIYPSLHEEVSTLLVEDDLDFDFFPRDEPESCIESYDTNIMGQFICTNGSCSSSGWGSKKIAITIRMYPDEKYNARVYYQRCKNCDSLSKPILNGTYAERVAYRIRKWCGIEVEPHYHSGKKSNGPHQSDRCEGCKDGHCTESEMFARLML